MIGLIKRIPVPAAGLMLGLAAGGNLVQQWSAELRLVMGLLAAIIFVLLTLKLILFKDAVVEELKSPVVASVAPTYSMGMMLLSVYIKPIVPAAALIMWLLAIVLHIGLGIYFSNKYLRDFKKESVMPSWFIVYVGIVAASVTSPAYSMKPLGQLLFWIGLVGYLALLPLVIRKLGRLKSVPEPVLPAIVIFCAPASLLLAGYMNAFESKNSLLAAALLIVSQLAYLYVLIKLPMLLRLRFYPSFAAFTFPVVITAISIKAASGYFTGIGLLRQLSIIEAIIAVVLVIYVLFRYIGFLKHENPKIAEKINI